MSSSTRDRTPESIRWPAYLDGLAVHGRSGPSVTTAAQTTAPSSGPESVGTVLHPGDERDEACHEGGQRQHPDPPGERDARQRRRAPAAAARRRTRPAKRAHRVIPGQRRRGRRLEVLVRVGAMTGARGSRRAAPRRRSTSSRTSAGRCRAYPPGTRLPSRSSLAGHRGTSSLAFEVEVGDDAAPGRPRRDLLEVAVGHLAGLVAAAAVDPHRVAGTAGEHRVAVGARRPGVGAL